MSLLDRYIARSVLFGTFITTFVLMTIFVILFFFAELKFVEGKYTVAKAAEFSLLTNTRMLRDLFPMLALIGSLLGLGLLANSNELTVMRAAGVSIGRITWSVMRVGIMMMVVITLFSEIVVPASEQYAKTMRATALNQKVFIGGNAGMWMRDTNTYINARTVKNNQRLENISVYKLDEMGRMESALQARRALYKDEQWTLYEVKETLFTARGTQVKRYKKMPWRTSLQPKIVDVVSIAPIDLSVTELIQVISHLSSNEQNTQRHEVAFWAKLFSPLATGLMVFLAIPFVFGSLRTVPISQRLLNGILLGLGFYLFNEGAIRFGVVYNIPPVVSAAAPVVLIALYAWWMFRRVR
ncbi:MAG: LPS export ABC transporter permease LptG [Gammaproteobacteria bacterium]|nr:LPS export ABC transporter permease LptG [Gammaproteobacteria bacterium]